MGRLCQPWLGVLVLGGTLAFVSATVTNQTGISKGGRSFIGHKSNSTNEDAYNIDYFATKILTGKLTTIFLPVIYIIVFIIGLPSNALALWVFFFRTKKKHPAVIYMANLALADLLFVIWFPLKIAYHINGNNWIYGEVLCKIVVVFFYGNMYCSILFMTCLSVQRYWVIANPILHSRKKSEIAMKVSAAVWILM
ncbi:proteinase-activated receptor 2 isoform 2-T2 [Vipera latastei]